MKYVRRVGYGPREHVCWIYMYNVLIVPHSYTVKLAFPCSYMYIVHSWSGIPSYVAWYSMFYHTVG